MRRPARKRGHAVAAFAFAFAATACNDELTEPQVEPASGGANALATGAGDRAVLVALYEATNGLDWDESDNWLTDAPLHEWHGVETDGSGRVHILRLHNNNLVGEIPSELGRLANLETLDLSYNGLSGEIPPELGGLAALQFLTLSDNDFVGEIPSELGRFGQLRFLDLDDNDLVGGIPSELGGLANLERLELSGNSLSGEIPPELGGLANLYQMFLEGNDLTGTIPSELGKLANLGALFLEDNNLVGEIPPELGSLANLGSLWLSNNAFVGAIPSELGGLSNLGELFWGGNTDLCAPGTRRFINFVRQLRRSDGPFCHDADAAVLRSFYHWAGGSDWVSSNGWLQPGPLADWYGIRTDSLSGRIVGLDLSRNGLSGVLIGLASLKSLRELRLSGNSELGGRLASRMTALPLRVLSYAETNLCTPADPTFHTWMRSIPSHSGTGIECSPLSDRDVLETLFYGTSGQDWKRSDNWLSDAPLNAWHGVATDASGRVQTLGLSWNGLVGEIPSELGHLSNLEELYLSRNDLTGEIPSELGHLSNLEGLYLGGNDLTGEIPSELGSLSRLDWLNLSSNSLVGGIPSELGSLTQLRYLFLGYNDLGGEIPAGLGRLSKLIGLDLARAGLTGEIPSGLGSLANLQVLRLKWNSLSGEVPPELGGLGNLESLTLDGNDLTGEIPAELGRLATLEWLDLNANELSGEIPSDLGHLVSLRHLFLAGNDLDGEIPSDLGHLVNLETLSLGGNANLFGALPLTNWSSLKFLQVGGTGLCVSNDFAVELRLRSLWSRYVRICKTQTGAPRPTAAAYVVQAVQSLDYPVPLVAGRPGLLRVLVAAPGGWRRTRVPSGLATFYQRDGSKHNVRVPGEGWIPAQIEAAEHSLSLSANVVIPGEMLQPGVEMVVVLDPVLGVPGRIPETGRMTLDVYEMPPFNVTVIPFLWESAPDDSSIVDATSGLTADAPLFRDTRDWLPVGPMNVTVHEPVWVSTKGWAAAAEVDVIRTMEGGTGYYMGTMSGVAGGVAGRPGKTSFSELDAQVVAHEFGHNLNLGHAPCAVEGELGYPHARGRSGAWGWDHRSKRLVPPKARDVMGYCTAEGISDYHFANALRWRLRDETGIGATRPTRALLLWGGIDVNGRPFLEPAFVVQAPPTRLNGTGAWQIAGETEDGRVLFTRRFEMTEMADSEGRQSFTLAVATEAGWAAALSRIVLTGPDGSVAITEAETGPATALLQDPVTGAVRGILRNWWRFGVAAQPDEARAFPDTDLEVQVSAGLPRPNAWHR